MITFTSEELLCDFSLMVPLPGTYSEVRDMPSVYMGAGDCDLESDALYI